MKRLKDQNVIVRGLFAYAGAFRAIEKSKVGDLVALEREPSNPHDANAIKVILWASGLFRKKPVHVGYIPRGTAKSLAPRMDSGAVFQVIIAKSWLGDDRDHCSLTLTVRQMDGATE